MVRVDAADLGTTRVSFGDVELDVAAMDLRRSGHRVPVEPQVFDVLRYLIEHRDRVVPKEELLDQVWGDRFVSESALTSRIRSARAAVGDDGQQQAVIRTVHGRGYQFVAPVTERSSPVIPPQPDGARLLSPTRPRFEGTIPRPAKTLVDRVDLSARLGATLAPGRLVTLVGPAGVGKTLLAQHVAASLGARFPDGSWAVHLAEVRRAGGVGQAVLDALGATRFPAGTAEETVASVLTGVDGLLLLDNCEHVLADVASLVGRLLPADGHLALLATSRRRLGVPGEVVVDVPVLEADHGVELFTLRAAEQGLGLEPGSPVVAELCEALDQLPLALELASAQARVLGVDQLAGLLDRRLELLGSGDAAAESRTLEGAIATSFADLAPDLQETLGRFAQFSGWFDLDAATTVATAGRDLSEIGAVQHVVALGERSLLEVDTARPVTRYRLLESIRLYADERLADHDEARRAHVRCFRARAVDRGRRLAGPDVDRAWQEIRDDWTNIRAAVAYALDLGLLVEALDLLNATTDYAEIALAFEHGLWADAALAQAAAVGDEGAAVREARAGRARLLSYERRLDEQRALAEAAGDPATSYSTALAELWRAGAHGDLEGLERAYRLLEEQVRGTGGIRELTLGAISHLAAHNPAVDPTEASMRALRVGRSTGSVGRAFARVIEANLALSQGRVDDVLRACDDCVQLAEEQALAVLASQACSLRVRAVRSHDDLGLVGRCVLEAMRHYRSRGNWASARNDAPVAARVIAGAGLHEEAADVLDGYRPVRYRSVDPEYVAEVRRLISSSLGSGLDALVREGAGDDPERFCDFVIAQLDEALRRLPGEDG